MNQSNRTAPLFPEIDEIENSIFFSNFLTAEQMQQVKQTSDELHKRILVKTFIQQNYQH